MIILSDNCTYFDTDDLSYYCSPQFGVQKLMFDNNIIIKLNIEANRQTKVIDQNMVRVKWGLILVNYCCLPYENKSQN